MALIILYVFIGILTVIGIWQLIVWMFEIRDKNRKYRAATSFAAGINKPVLVAGGPWGAKKARHWFNKPAHGEGDVCLDIDRRAIEGHPCAVVASVTHIPFADNTFGAAFASHLLEHLPTVGNARQALDELNRVAEAVYIVYPSRQSIAGWIIPEHRLWVWQEGNDTYLQQRGKTGTVEVHHC